MLTVGDIKIRVQRAFGDESEVQVTDDDIVRWINDGQKEIVMMNDGLLEKFSLANLTANEDEYSLPADILILRSIKVKTSVDISYTSLKWYSYAQFDEAINGWEDADYVGRPVMFTTYANKVFLFPKPDADSTNGLKFLYSYIPTEVAVDADNLSLPVAYHNAVVKYCLIKANEMDEDFSISGQHLQQFQQDMGVNKEKEKWGARELYPTITVLSDDL